MEESNETDNSFIVKDSIGVCIFAGVIFSIMFISAFSYMNFNNTSVRTDIRIVYLTIIPAIIFFVKAYRSKPILEINKFGIYFCGELLTNWTNFISAKYIQEPKTLSISDNFVLLIEYDKPEMPTTYFCKINLPATLNKSEEEIISAIEKYHKHLGETV